MDAHKHKWERYGGCRENPGMHSSGGSVVIASRCTACGAEKREDYWNHRDNKPRKTAKIDITHDEAHAALRGGA